MYKVNNLIEMKSIKIIIKRKLIVKNNNNNINKILNISKPTKDLYRIAGEFLNSFSHL
jgi:hypothetical protein